MIFRVALVRHYSIDGVLAAISICRVCVFASQQRHKEDTIMNSIEYEVVRSGVLSKLQSQHIVVGDILRINRGEHFPADLILLSSSQKDGIAYIETSNLDGCVCMR